MSLRHLRLHLCLLLFCSPFVLAQKPAPAPSPASSPCRGTVTSIRVSEIKPGKLNDFMAAVNAQRTWYRHNGVTTNKILRQPRP